MIKRVNGHQQQAPIKILSGNQVSYIHHLGTTSDKNAEYQRTANKLLLSR